MLKGLYAVLVTPFDSQGKIDEAGLERLVEFYLERKVNGLITLSVMGESATLSETERLQVIKRVIGQNADRTPVIVGVNREDTKTMSQFGQRAVALGASGLLVAPPILDSPNSQAIIDCYRTIADATEAPIVVLDYPPLTGILSVSLLKDLAQQVEKVCAVKLEDLPTPVKVEQLRSAIGDRLKIFGARGALYCLQELERGSDGLMTGYAFPEHLLEILNKFRAGDRSGAFAAYTRWLPLFVFASQSDIGIALRKEMLKHRGIIASSAVRSPTREIDPQTRAELLQLLQQMGISPESAIEKIEIEV